MNEFRNSFSLRDVQEHWDKVSDEYDHTNEEHAQTHDQRWVEATKHMDLDPGMVILDIFCRTGDAIKYLAKECEDVIIIGAELSGGMLNQARKKYPQNMFLLVSPHALPFKDNSFDIVLSLETLEHIPDPPLFLSEIRRVLKANGKLVMSLPPSTAEYTSIIVDLLHLHHGEGPHKFLSPKTVKRIIKKADLELIKHKGTLLIPVGPKFLRDFGVKIEDKIQSTFLREVGIRQFYICEKK